MYYFININFLSNNPSVALIKKLLKKLLKKQAKDADSAFVNNTDIFNILII